MQKCDRAEYTSGYKPRFTLSRRPPNLIFAFGAIALCSPAKLLDIAFHCLSKISPQARSIFCIVFGFVTAFK